MGAHPYWYTVTYKPDVAAALQELRKREFQAGRYNPVIPFPNFPISPDSPTPGAGHATMAEVLKTAGASGTRSILDLDRVSDEPDYGAVAGLGNQALQSHFRTTRPTREMVEAGLDLWEGLERGQGIFIVLYKNAEPDEIYFAGYSYD